MRPEKDGKFITFEGIEGSGKSTIANRLSCALIEHKIPVVLTREPGGTPLGNEIRRLLLDTASTPMTHPMTELLLFTADRLEHMATVIEPAMATGNVVVSDRFVDSTFAYQYGGRNLPRATVDAVMNLINLRPSLTFFLDVDPEIGAARVQARGGANRFDMETLEFMRRVRAAYLIAIAENPNRFVQIDTSTRSETDVFDQVWETVQRRLYPLTNLR